MCVLTLFSSSVLTSFKTLLVLGLAILTQLKKMEEGLSSIVVGNQNSLYQKQEDNLYALIFKSNALMFILDWVSHKSGEEGFVNEGKSAIGVIRIEQKWREIIYGRPMNVMGL